MTDNGSNGNGAHVITPIAEQPTIDFDELSWGDTKAIVDAAYALQNINPEADGEKITTLFRNLENIIAPIVLSIPRSWLVRRAPENIEYGQPAALNWLRKDRFLDLVNAVAAGAQEAEVEAKN